jgi:DNA (cytosine-5)-methyltransferase 1
VSGLYFNEIEPFAAQWLGNLWPEATVDKRDIRDVQPRDVAGFQRVHWFAGISGWEQALQLAGWPSDLPVWTASCPCQPLSCAGKRAGEKDERHLWPELYRLISERRPGIIFGEQVESSDGLEWLDGISLDLEELDYAVGPLDLPAASVGAPQRRQRFFWVGVASGYDLGRLSRSAFGTKEESERSRQVNGDGCVVSRPAGDVSERVANAESGGFAVQRPARFTGNVRHTDEREPFGGLVDAAVLRRTRSNRASKQESGLGSRRNADRLEFTDSDRPRGERAADGRAAEAPWASEVVYCRDDKYRRVAVEPGSFPLAYGIPRDLGRRIPELRSVARSARANRVGRLKGYGNAIVPAVAAVFIRAFIEAIQEPTHAK